MKASHDEQRWDDMLRAVAPRTATAGQTQPAEADDGAPDFAGPYRAFAHPRPFALPSLVLYFNAAERRKYGQKKVHLEYEHFDSDDPLTEGFAADGQSFSFVVCTSRKAMRITIRGRDLEQGYDWLILHRLAWLRSADRDFGEVEGAVVTGIEIETVQETV